MSRVRPSAAQAISGLLHVGALLLGVTISAEPGAARLPPGPRERVRVVLPRSADLPLLLPMAELADAASRAPAERPTPKPSSANRARVSAPAPAAPGMPLPVAAARPSVAAEALSTAETSAPADAHDAAPAAALRTGGFDMPAAARSARAETKQVGMFDDAHGARKPQERPRPTAETPVAADFDLRETRPANRAIEAKPAARATPVEILSKPTPAYTDAARELRVEGEVLLDVEFRAAGEVKVLAVLRGLGHGLDEEAIVAARRITFRPATRDGRPVDTRTTVQIVFRLA